jgi:hypothetical protein
MTKEEIWYIVKQEREFWKVCYAVKILDDYKKEENPNSSLVNYFSDKADEIKSEKDFDRFISTHRMLRIGYFYGLIRSKGVAYKSAELTEVYFAIKNRCKGNFENIDSYYDLMEQQIEKIYFSTKLDRKYDGIREKYRLYPLFTLYKMLIVLGEITGEYTITEIEFKVFVSTIEKFEDYFFTVHNILEYRKNEYEYTEINDIFQVLKKYNRYKEVIKNLDVFNILENEPDKFISIKDNYISYIKEKVYKFEKEFKELNNLSSDKYFNLLCSNQHLLVEDRERDGKMQDINDVEKNEINDDISRNLIIYGAPGTGKSWLLENEYRKVYFPNNCLYTRITLHENFSYTDFVGTYKPTPIYEQLDDERKLYEPNKKTPKEDNMIPHIDYEFSAGIFLEMYIKAKNNPDYNFAIILEELNRANVASVFGDIFQLLDRNKDGVSEYPIELNKDAKNYIISKIEDEDFDGKIVLPDNLYILATMNNADQNVTRIDTAFKRRWDFKHININFNMEIADNRYLYLKFLNGYIKWNDFRKVINDYCMLELEIPEDRLIGTFFINEIEKDTGKENEIIKEDAFKYKLLMYLRDDLFRYNPSEIFRDSSSLGQIIQTYENSKDIFNTRILELLQDEEIKDEVD